MKACLFGTCSNNVAAYCRRHRKNLTVKQMKCKDCLQKECWHLVKNEKHQYWRQRELIKQKKKSKKQMMNDYILTVTGGM